MRRCEDAQDLPLHVSCVCLYTQDMLDDVNARKMLPSEVRHVYQTRCLYAMVARGWRVSVWARRRIPTHAVTIRNASTFYTLPTHFRDEDIVLLQGAATAGLT